ncbi:hypothetical protein chiPu_0033035, partial [Chiloscyllium punctatum]|nr:hypothetical protein [Chiloscyllium punctatum]
RRLRCGSDTKRRRQLRLAAGQADRIERGRCATGAGPDIGKDFTDVLHAHSSLRLTHARA